MELRLHPRSHMFDGAATWCGSRLLTLDMWIEASADEVSKLKRFNMMKQEFLTDTELCTGTAAAVSTVLFAGASWAAWNMAAPEFAIGAGGLAAGCLWQAKRSMGRTSPLTLKVKDVVNRPVPFTRDNPADIHEIAVRAEEKYQHLFGAMYEIEAFGSVREFTWKQEVTA